MIDVNNYEFIWAQKFRPKTLEQCILPESIKVQIRTFLDKGEMPNLLLVGSQGLGKTTLAKVIANELNADFLFINASKDRNIDTLRDKITEFASSVSFSSGRKIVILDEGDFLNPTSTMPSLRAFTEEFSSNCIFIMTANYVNKIIPPLRSRFTQIDFSFTKEEKTILIQQTVKRFVEILQSEKVVVTKETVSTIAVIVKKYFPDIRSMLNIMQQYSVTGTLTTESLSKLTDSKYEMLIEFVKNRKFQDMRKWVSENSDVDMAMLISDLYREFETKITGPSLPALILVLNKYDYQNSFVMNKELNIVACLTEIMTEVTFNDN